LGFDVLNFIQTATSSYCTKWGGHMVTAYCCGFSRPSKHPQNVTETSWRFWV